MNRIVILLATVAFAAFGAEGETKEWDTEAQGSLLLTSGNTSVTTFGVGGKTKYTPGVWAYTAEAGFLTSVTSGTKTAEQITGLLRGDRSVTDTSSVFASLTYLQDFFSGFSGRYSTDLGYSFGLLKSGPHHLVGETSFGYQIERRTGGIDNDFFNAAAAILYNVALSSNTKFTTALRFRENLENTSDWRLNFENSLLVSMSDALSLKVGFNVGHLNIPVAGKVSTDTATTLAIVAKL